MANSKEKNQVYQPLALWQAWKRIFAFTRPYLFRFVLGLLFTALSTAIWLTIPLGLRSLLDSVFEQGDRDMLDFLALALLGLFVLQSLFHMGSHYWTSWVGERVVTDLRKRVYEHFHCLGLRFYADRRLGELMSRLTNDIGAIREAATEAILYEFDPDFRSRERKRRIREDDSFGGSLRRLRLQKGIKRSDFPPLTSKSIARIERGEVITPHRETREILAKHLGVNEEDIATY